MISGNVMAIISVVFWAAGFPAAEILLDSWHPIALTTLRLLVVMVALLALWVVIDGANALRRARWGRGLWIGMLGFGTGANLLLFAQWYTDPVTVALIATATPISATIIELLCRQRRLRPRFVFGLIVSVLGGLIAVGEKFSVDLGWGVLMAISSGICFVWASNAAVRDFPDLSPIGRSTITFAGATLLTVPVFLFGWSQGLIAAPTIETVHQIGLLLVYAVGAMAVSQILFIASVARIGIALSSIHMNAAPFYVMLILMTLGGSWDWRAAFGAVIVGVGVVLSQPRHRKPEGHGS